MPELPEVETVRRGLEPIMTGATIRSVEQRRRDLRFPFPEKLSERLNGRKILNLGRRAKYLLVEMAGDETLVCHLGMSGSFRVESSGQNSRPGAFYHPRSALGAHDHLVLELDCGARVIYNDPRRFGFMELIKRAELSEHPFFRELGIEPLGNELSGNVLAALFKTKKAPLKAALLDQRLVAGLGNIYVCEALHRSGLSPRRAAGTLARRNGSPTEGADRLATEIKRVLEDALKSGGSTLRDHRLTDGTLGYFQHSFRVYDREGKPCMTVGCSGSIRRIVQAGRSTFYCAKCQK